MAQFETFAEILTPDDPKVQAFRAGVLKSHPGMLWKDVLKRVDADWTTTTYLNDEYRENLRRVAEFSNDSELLAISQKRELTVSVRHLRDTAPDAWVAVGTRVRYTDAEQAVLKTASTGYDPRKAFLIP